MKESEEHANYHELRAALWRLDILVQQALIMGHDDPTLRHLLAKALQEIQTLITLTKRD